VGLKKQNILLNARVKQLSRRLACESPTEAVFRIHRVADEIRDTNDCAPGPVAVDVIEKLQELRIKHIHWCRCYSSLVRQGRCTRVDGGHCPGIPTRRHLCYASVAR